MEALFYFVFFYPLFMAFFWMGGALLFFVRHERGQQIPPHLEQPPPVAVLIPCHNEANNIRATLKCLQENHYPNCEIVAINDGSIDATGAILDELSKSIPQLRVIHLARNYGKAMALRAGALATRAEYLMCIDADTFLDKNALFWMLAHFQNGPRVGAVTGNPRLSNRRTLLSRIQVGEFSSIIGMVKRSQRDIGRVFTVSGCHVCYRRRALHDIGYWSAETVTEDIDISWKLQLHYWDIRFEPRALAWIKMPDTLRGLWRQRLRWARGGIEAAMKFRGMMLRWTSRRMWPIYIEYIVGSVWCYAWATTVVFWVMTNLMPSYWPDMLSVPTLMPRWTGVILGTTCLFQFLVGLYLDSHYEKGIFRAMFWAIWYPAVYWMIASVATIIAIPSALYWNGRVRYATWDSPERGVT